MKCHAIDGARHEVVRHIILGKFDDPDFWLFYFHNKVGPDFRH